MPSHLILKRYELSGDTIDQECIPQMAFTWQEEHGDHHIEALPIITHANFLFELRIMRSALHPRPPNAACVQSRMQAYPQHPVGAADTVIDSRIPHVPDVMPEMPCGMVITQEQAVRECQSVVPASHGWLSWWRTRHRTGQATLCGSKHRTFSSIHGHSPALVDLLTPMLFQHSKARDTLSRANNHCHMR